MRLYLEATVLKMMVELRRFPVEDLHLESSATDYFSIAVCHYGAFSCGSESFIISAGRYGEMIASSKSNSIG